jgi:hypothetical protein
VHSPMSFLRTEEQMPPRFAPDGTPKLPNRNSFCRNHPPAARMPYPLVPPAQTRAARSSVNRVMPHIDEVILLALATWSAISIVVVLVFGAFVRAGRRSWSNTYDADYLVGRSPARTATARPPSS